MARVVVEIRTDVIVVVDAELRRLAERIVSMRSIGLQADADVAEQQWQRLSRWKAREEQKGAQQ